MIFYSQKDVKVQIGGEDVYCTDITLKYNIETALKLEAGHKNAFEYVPAQPPKGTFTFSYYLTGEDPLVQNIINEKNPIPINFAGMSVNSGYLNSYSFKVEPYKDTLISAGVAFYEKINGEFVSAGYPELPDAPPLSMSDLSLDNGAIVKEENIKNFSYSYSPSITPTYEVSAGVDAGGKPAVGVVSGPKKIQVAFSLHDYDMSLPITGQQESFKINFKDKNGNSKQTYEVNGFIRDKSIGARVGEYITADYSLAQANLGGVAPVISSVTVGNDSSEPYDIATGQMLQIDGSNFVNMDKVLLGEFPCKIMEEKTIYTSDFYVGLDGWVAAGDSNGTLSHLFEYHDDAPSAIVTPAFGKSRPGSLHFRAHTSPGTHYIYRPSVFEAGKKYKVSGSVWIAGTANNIDHVSAYTADTAIAEVSTPKNTWVNFSEEITIPYGTVPASQGLYFLTFTASPPGSQNYAGGGTASVYDDFYIADIEVTEWPTTSTEIHAQSSFDMLSGYMAPMRVITQAGMSTGITPVLTVETGVTFF